MANSIQETRDLGQSIWYDNVSRGLIASGAMAALVDAGITGLTSNPTIFEKAIAAGDDYDEQLLALALAGANATGAFEGLAIEDIQAVADLLRPVYDATGGADGFASLEVSPTLAHDTEATVAEAQRLFAALDRPNVMIKVPGTPEGVPAVERLIGQGINVNVTLLFHRDAFSRVRDAYIAGLERLAESGGDLSRVASVASFFVSRVDAAVDGLLAPRVHAGEEELADLLGRAAIANAALAYRDFQETVATPRFQALREKGARVQRPLWASTGAKNPEYSDVLYIDSLIAPDTVNTMPPATLDSYLDHGVVALSLEPAIPGAERVMQSLEDNGVSMTEVTDKLLADGVRAFADSFVTLLANVEEKKAALLASHYAAAVALGDSQPAVAAAASELAERHAVRRIWDADHTLWKPDPTELSNRLGWLTLPTDMRPHASDLQSFADEVRGMGVRDVVLLGMGGSSLGAEALRTVFGEADGRPRLTVLDTTVPAWIAAARDAIDVSHALFLVSSKSGGTLETLAGYRCFRSLADAALGSADAGRRVVAITDAGSGLDRLAREEGFLRIFLNPETIGGRYSVLSFFGLVPAALTGIDVMALLDRAALMQCACAPSVPAEAHPGLQLGAALGALAKAGRDKLTFVTTPGLGSFGLWAEQLIAESLGKEGFGIVPIADEPLLAPDCYGPDRVFAYLRLDGDDAQPADDALAALEAAGHPVLRFRLRDRCDLAAEMYRWEFATAVAGALLGVNPFDQPNVQGAKDKTAEVLAAYERDGALPQAGRTCSVGELLAQAAPGDYLCVMAYVRRTPEVDAALEALRRRVMEGHGIATTSGYGPRFLHSTGQLHKGGPATGLFLQVIADHAGDIEIPGQGYSFGTLADAQALGDLQALQAAGLRVARLHITGDVSNGLAAI